jgi:hypothetical protein
MIVLDTSVRIAGLTGMGISVSIGAGFRWRRSFGNARPDTILPFGRGEGWRESCTTPSAGLALDLMIAACAIVRGAPLWTLNPRDFDDIPGLKLYRLA